MPVVVAIVWIIARKQKGFRKNLICSIRSIICVLLVLAMAGTGVRNYADITTTIFAADMSRSMLMAKTSVEDFIKEGIKHKTDKDYLGVVAFGEKTAVEISPAKEIQFRSFASYVDESGTDIESALKMAASLIDEESQKKIVLISDGNETTESAVKYANLLASSNIKVDGVYIESSLEEEVQITSLNTPNFMDKDTEFEVETVIHSLTSTSANVKVFKGIDLVVNRDVVLRTGENKFVFTDISTVGGGVIYRAEISSPDDTMTENNRFYSYTYVEDVPAILIVENENNSAREFAKILEKSNVRVKVITETQVPASLEQLNLWDCVVLADVSAENLSVDFLAILETFVRTAGGGVITLGGENSYALGGYQNTVLNDILPVSMSIKTEGEKPDLGMVMVIDRSGSMTDSAYGVSRMEMAKEAAMRAVGIMEPTDTVGVVVFDSEPTWAVEIQKVGENASSIVETIGKVQPGGGTSILPALEEAYRVLKDIDTKTKHMILLTDGQAETSGYDSVISGMRADGITLSTIAVGSGADIKLLSELAEKGGGRYYFTNEFTNLPQIFTKETTLAGKDYINNYDFFPQGKDAGAILSGIESVPLIKGYISTTAKPRADVLLESDKNEPILATWQYGIGRTASWMSDANGHWTSTWLANAEGVAIFRNAVSWVIRGGISSEVVFSGELSGENAIIKAQMPYNSDVKTVHATILSDDGKETKTQMTSFAPGVYTAEVDGIYEGGYIISLSLETYSEKEEVIRGGFIIGYPKEYDLQNFGNGKEIIEKIVNITGGRMIENPEEIFVKTEKVAIKTFDISYILIAIALLFLLLEIAFRRLTFLTEKIEKTINGLVHSNVKIKNIKKEYPMKEKNNDFIKQKDKNLDTENSSEKKEKMSTAAELLKNKKNRR